VSRLTERLAGLRNRAFLASDIALLSLCAAVAVAARYEGPWPAEVPGMLWALILVGVPIKVLLLLLF
jgi:hypothetical protein